jgi:anaerobic magnesium-protoporphyrin IX monomethyl ester cyclase
MVAVSVSRLTQKIRTARAVESPPILMVTPPSVFLLDERVFMSLGILKVAAVLESAGKRVEHLDLTGVENFLEVTALQAQSSDAKIVALTTTTPQLPAAVRIAECIRSVRPDMRLILGGPHVTLVAAAVKLERKAGRIGRAHRAMEKLESLFDVLVAGDGELAVFDAIGDNPLKLIDGDEPRDGLFMDNAVYEESPPPARHLGDPMSYKYTIDGHPATTLIGQLGCPFGCGFCGGRNSKALRKIRSRSTASIVREVEALHLRYGFTGFNFFDDELNVSQAFVELLDALTTLQQHLGVEFRLRGFVKSELFTEEQASAMFRAGFRWVLCGFEAASPRILENIQKRATLEDNTRVVAIAKRHGLKTKALMSVGHPGESEESILAVRDWLLDVKPEDFDCTVITTYPGTPYYDEALAHESLPDVWTYTCKKSSDRLHAVDIDFTQTAEYYKGAPGNYHAYVFTDHLSGDDIVRLRDVVESDVRAKLGIPFNLGNVALRYEHSMGMGALPSSILRKSVASEK